MTNNRVRAIDAARVREHLRAAGHWLCEDDPEFSGPTEWPGVCPAPHQVIMLATHRDFTVRRAFRSAYFIVQPVDDPILRSDLEASCLADRDRGETQGDAWEELLEFSRGPLLWLSDHINVQREIWFWAQSNVYAAPSTGCYSALNWLTDSYSGRDPLDACALEIVATRDGWCRLLYECARAVNISGHTCDYYLLESATRSLFVIHHHNRINCIVPDETLRAQHLREMSLHASRFVDVSNYYESEWDDEWE